MTAFLSRLLLIVLLPCYTYATNKFVKHPFHVSTTEIAYNAKNKSLELTCRIFTDDFEDVLFKNFKGKIDLQNKSKEQEMNKLIALYLQKNLNIYISNKIGILKFIGFENDHEATNVYMEINGISTIKQVKIFNTILYDLFTDQINIVHFEMKGKRQSSKIVMPDKEINLSF